MAARQGYDLFNKHGRHHFMSDLKRGQFNSYVWRDTLGKFACAVLGHKVYTSDGAKACKRCCKYL